MPLIVLYLPEQCFNPQQKQQFAQQATQNLLKLEGMEQQPKAQNLSWVQFSEFGKEDFFLAGHQVEKPHYRIDIKVFQGTLNNERKALLTEQLTKLVLDIEGTNFNLLNAARVWVMINEIPDGNWGGAGKIYRIKDLMQMMQS